MYHFKKLSELLEYATSNGYRFVILVNKQNENEIYEETVVSNGQETYVIFSINDVIERIVKVKGKG